MRQFILLFVLAAIPILAQLDTGTLSVTIRDKSSGEVVPAMICITSLADNTWRVPPDGRLPAGYVTNPNFILGRLKGPDWVMGAEKKWSPGDPGPVVLMAGKFADDPTEGKVPYMQSKRKRNLWYDGKPAIPFWKEPAAYFVSKPFTITLPPGKWRLAVMRGIEYTPVSEEFTVTPARNWSVTSNWYAGWRWRSRAGTPAICTSTPRAARRSRRTSSSPPGRRRWKSI